MRPWTRALVAATLLTGACPDTSDDTDDTDSGDDSDSGDTDDSDTSDTGDDTGTDTGLGWDVLYMYPASPACDDDLDNQWGVTPKADGSWAAGRFPADNVTPMTVYQVRVLLRHGADSQGTSCDSAGAFEMRLVITDTATPPDDTADAARTKSFAAAAVTGTTRALVYTLETPLVVPNSDNLWVAVDGNDGSLSSCWQACRQNAEVLSNQSFFTEEAAPASWTWQGLSSYGVTDDEKLQFMMTVWYLE